MKKQMTTDDMKNIEVSSHDDATVGGYGVGDTMRQHVASFCHTAARCIICGSMRLAEKRNRCPCHLDKARRRRSMHRRRHEITAFRQRVCFVAAYVACAAAPEFGRVDANGGSIFASSVAMRPNARRIVDGQRLSRTISH